MIGKQHLHFVGGKRCRGFVHDQDAGLAVHGAGDLDDPLHVMREIAHPGLGRQPLEAHALEQGSGAAFQRAGGRRAGRALGQRGDHDVFGDRQVGKDRQFLRQHADAERERVGRGPDLMRAAVDRDRAGIAGIVAGQDLHQRRLAGAIGAEQGDDLAGVEMKADIAEHGHAAERLADTGHIQDSSRRP